RNPWSARHDPRRASSRAGAPPRRERWARGYLGPMAVIQEQPRNGRIEVRLGRTTREGVAPSMFVWVERGVERRPEVAREIRGRVAFRFQEEISPLAVHFGPDAIDVFDGDVNDPELAVSG